LLLKLSTIKIYINYISIIFLHYLFIYGSQFLQVFINYFKLILFLKLLYFYFWFGWFGKKWLMFMVCSKLTFLSHLQSIIIIVICSLFKHSTISRILLLFKSVHIIRSWDLKKLTNWLSVKEPDWEI
jgi:hypothetical protein